MDRPILIATPAVFQFLIPAIRWPYWEASKDDERTWHPFATWEGWTIRSEVKWQFRQLDESFTPEGQARLDLEERRRKLTPEYGAGLPTPSAPPLPTIQPLHALATGHLWKYLEVSTDGDPPWYPYQVWRTWVSLPPDVHARWSPDAFTPEGRARLDDAETNGEDYLKGNDPTRLFAVQVVQSALATTPCSPPTDESQKGTPTQVCTFVPTYRIVMA